MLFLKNIRRARNKIQGILRGCKDLCIYIWVHSTSSRGVNIFISQLYNSVYVGFNSEAVLASNSIKNL